MQDEGRGGGLIKCLIMPTMNARAISPGQLSPDVLSNAVAKDQVASYFLLFPSELDHRFGSGIGSVFTFIQLGCYFGRCVSIYSWLSAWQPTLIIRHTFLTFYPP